MRRVNRGLVAAILFVIIFLLMYFFRSAKPVYQRDEGFIFGTVYHVTYRYDKNLLSEIQRELEAFDLSLSPFNEASVISKVNRNESIEVDDWFRAVFLRSKEIYKSTGGAFDPTLSPLINAWGFGFKNGDTITPVMIDSLLEIVGMNKVELKGGRVIKEDNRVTLNFSAIAKGYATDVIGKFLEKKGITDYLVEIGGEIIAKGKNPKGELWSVGISKPQEENDVQNSDIEEIIRFTDAAVATSGNYRNYHLLNGRKVAHTIDPASGYPVRHSLLSATVMAPDCMTADAYATAFMVLGVERSKEILAAEPELDALLIFASKDDTLGNEYYMTPGFAKRVREN